MSSTRISRQVNAPRASVYPSGVPAADNEAGWRSSLAKLAALVEAEEDARPGKTKPLKPS